MVERRLDGVEGEGSLLLIVTEGEAGKGKRRTPAWRSWWQLYGKEEGGLLTVRQFVTVLLYIIYYDVVDVFLLLVSSLCA